MRLRSWILPFLFLSLLAPAVSAKQPKPHAVGKHPKANHPMSKVNKANKAKVKKARKFKH